MTGFLQDLGKMLHTQLERHHNLPFLKATMAASAIVAIADGSIEFSQRIRVDQVLDTLEALKVFDPHQGVDLFNEYANAILADPESGHARAVSVIMPMAENPEIAKLLIRVCCAISKVSGDMKLVEKIEIISLCSLLDVQPADCDVDTDYMNEHAAE